MFELAKTTNAGGGCTFLMLRLEDLKADCRQSAECFCEAKHADTFNAGNQASLKNCFFNLLPNL